MKGYWKKEAVYTIESADLTTSDRQEMTFKVIVPKKNFFGFFWALFQG